MSAPSVTIELLDELVKFGFTDDIFHIVNNFNNDTIAQYRLNCSGFTGNFQSGSVNDQVQRRLAMVLKSFMAGGFTNMEVFRYLAHASVAEVPYEG